MNTPRSLQSKPRTAFNQQGSTAVFSVPARCYRRRLVDDGPEETDFTQSRDEVLKVDGLHHIG
jgi:hypothetical protein